MRVFKLQITAENGCFSEHPAGEIQRLLAVAAVQVGTGLDRGRGVLFDGNGNQVGHWTFGHLYGRE